MLASHYVLKHIYLLLKKEDLGGAEELFDKFTSRYANDTELIKLGKEFSKALKAGDEKQINEVYVKLKRMINARRIGRGSGGASTLPMKGRRPGIDSWIKFI